MERKRHTIGRCPHVKIDGEFATILASVEKSGRDHIFPVGEMTLRYFRPVDFNGWSKAENDQDKASGVKPINPRSPE